MNIPIEWSKGWQAVTRRKGNLGLLQVERKGEMRVTLSHDEVMACVIALEARRKPGEWEKAALEKLLIELKGGRDEV